MDHRMEGMVGAAFGATMAEETGFAMREPKLQPVAAVGWRIGTGRWRRGPGMRMLRIRKIVCRECPGMASWFVVSTVKTSHRTLDSIPTTS
jgi:hypothetical protein